MLSNKSYRDKVVAKYFDRYSTDANISGEVFPEHFRKLDTNGNPQFIGRKKYVGEDGNGNPVFEKVKDDVQFKGVSLLLDGINQYSLTPYNELMNTVYNELSVFAWIKTENTTGNDTIVARYNSSSGSNRVFQFYISGGFLYANLSSNGTTSVGQFQNLKSEVQVNDNNWHYVGLIFNNGVSQFYIDGKAVTTTILSGETQEWLNNLSTTPLEIGSRNLGVADFMDGELGGLFIWDRALEEKEIRLYPNTIPSSPLIAYLIEEGEGLILEDSSGNNLDSTLNNGGTWVSPSDIPFSHLNQKGYNTYYSQTGASGTYRNTGITSISYQEGLVIDFNIRYNHSASETKGFITKYLSSSNDREFAVIIDETGLRIQISEDGTLTTTTAAVWRFSIADGEYERITFYLDISGEDSGVIKNGVKITTSPTLGGSDPDIYDKNLTTIHESDVPLIIGAFSNFSNNAAFDVTHVAIKYSSVTEAEAIEINNGLIFPGFDFVEFFKDATGNVGTDSSIGYIPTSLSNPDEDVLGNLLEYKGTLAPRAKIVDNPCLVLNGVQYVNIPTPIAVDRIKSIEIGFVYDVVNTSKILFGRTGAERFYIGFNSSGQIGIGLGSDTYETLFSEYGLIVGEAYIVTLSVEETDQWIFTLLDHKRKLLDSFLSIIDLTTSNASTSYIGRLDGASSWENFLPEVSLFYFKIDNRVTSTTSLEYVFSEGNGTTIYDTFINNYHGTVVNAVLPDIWGTQDVFAYSFFHGFSTKGLFNGTSDYLDKGNPSNLQIISDISFGAWIKTDASNAAIISKYQFTASNSRAWQLRITSGLLQVYISDDGTLNAGHYKQYQSQVSVNTGEWIFVACTFDASTSTLKMYLDGLEVTTTKSRDDAITSIQDNSHSVYIGAISNGSPVTFFEGEMRGAFIYDRVLTSGELSTATSHKNLPSDYVLLEIFDSSLTVHVPAKSSTIDAEDFTLDKKGFKETGKWNGAGKIQFADIPEMPSELRGQSFSKEELSQVSYEKLHFNNQFINITSESISDLERSRESIPTFTFELHNTIIALALFRLDPSFDLPVIEVYETGTNTSQWFGFNSNGELPISDILSFVGSNDGHVISFRDQDNPDKIFTNSTPTSAPRLIIAGVLQTKNGNPVLNFNGSQWLQKTFDSHYLIGSSSIRGIISSNGGQQILNMGNSGQRIMWERGYNFYTETENGGHSLNNLVETPADFTVANFGINREEGKKFYGFENDNSLYSETLTWNEGDINNSSTIYLGRRSSGQYLDGNIGEVLLYRKGLNNDVNNKVMDYLLNRYNIT